MSKPPVHHSKLVGDWLAIYTLDTRDGYPIVSELRVVACPSAWRDPEWRARHTLNGEFIQPFGPELRDVLDGTIKPGPVPTGGLTSRLLRKLAPSALQKQHQEALSLLPERLAHEHAYDPAGEPRRPGRVGRSDRFYVEIAMRYLAAIERGSRRPVADAAEELGYDPEYVRDLVHDARGRELLTKAPPGKSGGHLTQKARDLLEVNR